MQIFVLHWKGRRWWVFHHDLTPPYTHPHLHSCREGMGVCWFLCWPPYKVIHCFSRWFMNIYMHKLFGKWKLICRPTGDDLALWDFFFFFLLPKTVNLSTGDKTLHCCLSHTPKCLHIKLGLLCLTSGNLFYFNESSLLQHNWKEKQLSYTSYKLCLAIVTWVLQFWG